MSDELYAGLMSGTSLDAIDAVLVDFATPRPRLLATREHPLPDRLRHRLTELIVNPHQCDLDCLGAAHRELGLRYAEAVNTLLQEAGMAADAVTAIGCHGQTIRHKPGGGHGFTLQIGDGATLAAATGITVVNDFRSADIAHGGEGAPLAPGFHAQVFGGDTLRVIVNIGGIANISIVPADGPVTGFDTGPGNTLLDAWCREHLGRPRDNNGAWAASGTVNEALLDTLLADSYFALPSPKSTGREHFNPAWTNRHLQAGGGSVDAVDVQATLTEVTARTIADAIRARAAGADIYVCGGGAHNACLMERLAANLPGYRVTTTIDLGIGPDWVEAAAFAWLARARLQGEPANCPEVTGAARQTILGAIHAA